MSIWTQTIDRRTFLKGLGLLVGTATLGAADGFLLEPRWLDITHHILPVDGLPEHLRGYRVAQITDLHLTRLSDIHDELIAALKTFSPQLITLTGDVLDKRTSLRDAELLCDQLNSPDRTVVATLGNWEHWSGFRIDEIHSLYQRHNIPLLINEHLALPGGILIAGTDDGSLGRADIQATTLNLPHHELRILLTHAPGILDAYPHDAPSFDLTLCGHTHGGQITFAGFAPIRPPGSGSFVSGFYQTNAGPTYVSRGIGTSILPARFSCRPELPIFEFVPTN